MVISERSSVDIYNPDEMLTGEEKNERQRKFVEASVDLVRAKVDAHEKGAILADTFCRLTQNRQIREKAVGNATAILEKVAQKTGVDTKPFLFGLLGELATAELLHDLEGIEQVEYPKIGDDLRRMTDWKARTAGGRKLAIQTKTLSYTASREELGTAVLPVLNSMKTLEDLQRFFAEIKRVSDDFYLVYDGKIKKPSELDFSKIDFRELKFSILPDNRYVKTKTGAGDRNNRLEEICFQATRMHRLFSRSSEIPVMCLLGNEADINLKTGRPNSEARARAYFDLAKIQKSLT
ncbi:MAG: hypothetical protein NTW79_01765 [Candidatus Berkelbacteria bacterium]|nr:hypothetical protein [Candidatus Berkelbacteria bacterium]